jgi:hypothetical protein
MTAGIGQTYRDGGSRETNAAASDGQRVGNTTPGNSRKPAFV